MCTDGNVYHKRFRINEAYKVNDMTPLKHDQSIMVIKGLLEGLAFSFEFKDIEDCIQKTKHFGEEVFAAFLFFERLEVNSIQAGLKNLARAFSRVSQAITSCHDEAKIEQTILEMHL